MHRRFRRPDGGDERGRQNRRHQGHRHRQGKRVLKPHACNVLVNDLQDVVEIDRAQPEAQHEPEQADAERLDPDRAPDLPAQAADRLQDAELAPAVGDRHRQRVDDAQDRHQHGDGNLHRREAEPLVGDLQDVRLQLRVRQHEHLAGARVALEDAPPHLRHRHLRLQVHAEEVHRIVVPVLLEEASIHQDRALLIGVIHDDPDDGQADHTVGCGHFQDLAEGQMLELREVVGHHEPLPG